MYLSKLEIFGFKSFAQKTTIDFSEGVTSIVGPNGCGKTNIVDAIRWCLGEQKSSALRSDKMENVIFNGTTNRKPMGMSEVSLTIENTKGILPTEYTDITITRRIFRSGESEYLLNKNLCRLKDIVNLFMDTGIGANAYSVIELKMVETILSNKAEERRTMFEEAAGVNKYKLRRRLALRKLDEVKNDLTRVNDIVSEVSKKVSSLERQAKKADRYNKLSTALREKELDLAEREICLFSTQTAEANNHREENQQTKNQLESNIAKITDELESIKNDLGSAEVKLKQKRDEVTNYTEKAYNVKNIISISNERINSLRVNTNRYTKELGELKTQLEETAKSIESKSLEIEETRESSRLKEVEQQLIIEKVKEYKENLEEKRKKLKSHSDLTVTKLKKLSDQENLLSNTQHALNDKNEEIAELNNKILQLTNDVAKTVGFIENLNEERDSAAKKLEDAESNYTKKLIEKKELESGLNKLRESELELKAFINSLEDKIIFVQNLVDNLEGVSKGAKFLFENNDWANNEIALLANVGNTDENHRLAVEAALRNNLNNIIVLSLTDLKKGIKSLKENDLGRASFYLLNKDNTSEKKFSEKIIEFITNGRRKKIENSDGFVSWTSPLIKTDKKWNRFFDKILRQSAVVNNLETAVQLSLKYPGFSFTTPSGDYAGSSGIIESGAPSKVDDSLFGKKQLIGELKDKLPEQKKELEEISLKIKKQEQTINQIDMRLLSEKGKMLVNDLANIEKQVAQFEFERSRADVEIENTHSLIKELAASANKIDNSRAEFSGILEKLYAEKSAEDLHKIHLEEEFKKCEEEHNSIISKSNVLNLELERFLGDVKGLENSIKQAEDNIETIKNAISKREIDIQSAGDEISTIKITAEEKELEYKKLESKKEELKKEEVEIEIDYNKLKEKITALEKEQRKNINDKEAVLDSIRDADIKLNEIKIKKASLIEQIDENYSITIKQKSFDDLDSFNFKENREEVHNLKVKIRNLGPINLLAYSEFEEERSRMEFLIKQRDDLVESEKDIVNTIDEINNTAQAQFLDTFNSIRENFIKVFRILFDPGDDVDLQLEKDADPLEAKIEITAKPKGKRPTSIELLSGGEKTLTAIALLFAIYLVKPSPFCILDEIDAPLDDANIDRFTNILRDFSRETQFIVVTHNKRTMESAKTLYGVTMQEEGISKLVSVQFNEDLVA
ncbi:MAG: chromosome segregation protein SMC [Ignavibacteria bacterium]|nr:chromosome segregation protein SMC [Ignavibacteria bacterium]